MPPSPWVTGQEGIGVAVVALSIRAHQSDFSCMKLCIYMQRLNQARIVANLFSLECVPQISLKAYRSTYHHT